MRAHVLQLVLLFCISISFSLNAQIYNENVKMKFGKLEMEELQLTSYPKDTGAAAYVIADCGSTSFVFSPSKGSFDIIFERHCRVKILKTTGYDQANIKIYTRESGSLKETVSNLKASTYNLVNGKMVESKLSKKDIFEEKSTDNWTTTKFSMPNIEVGSVFEFSYKIYSDFTSIRDWYFQKSIPVAWSEYTIKVPEYYNFLQFSQGYERFYKQDRKKEPGSINIISNGRQESIMFMYDIQYWAVKDAAALQSEKFITTQDDFLTRMEFQMAYVKFPGSMVENILADWPEVQKKLLENENFGLQINRSGFMKTELQALTKDCADNNCKIARVYDFIRQNMEWNEKKRFTCESTVKKAFTDKVGNSADINLMLVAALREIGLTADPVILSTRDNGRINPVYPIINKYNYVIAAATVDGKTILLDATDKFIAPGQLPERCLNFQGRLISESNSRWIDLNNFGESTEMFSAKLKLEEDGSMVGDITITSSGYDAINKRRSITFSEEEFLKNLKDKKKTWEISSHSFENLDKLSEKLLSKYQVSITDAAQPAGNTIFIQPLLNEGLTENPFKQEKRLFPIDFTHPSANIFYLNLTIPEGYTVEELPKNAAWALPDNAGSFSYNAAKNGNTITITTNYSIKKSFFNSDQFPYLKEFYNLMVAKCAEQIVLKKTSSL